MAVDSRDRRRDPATMFSKSAGVGLQLKSIFAESRIKMIQGMLATAKQRGLEKEEFTEDLKKEVERLKQEQRDAKKKRSFFKVLDFVPGGKWIKTIAKAGVEYDIASDMRKLLGGMSADFEKKHKGTFLSGGASTFAEQLRDMRAKIDPTQIAAGSFFGDVLSEGFGEQKTFKEAFASDTPFADVFREKYGFEEGEKLGERLKRGIKEFKEDDFIGKIKRLGLTGEDIGVPEGLFDIKSLIDAKDVATKTVKEHAVKSFDSPNVYGTPELQKLYKQFNIDKFGGVK